MAPNRAAQEAVSRVQVPTAASPIATWTDQPCHSPPPGWWPARTLRRAGRQL